MASEVTDDEIAAAFKGTNFGDAAPRPLLANSVLKTALRYHCGHTITQIMVRMDLITAKGHVTERGRQFCYRECHLERSG